MRREKKRAEKIQRFYAQEAKLREKRKRKLNPPLGKAANRSLSDGTVAGGAPDGSLHPATFLSASGK